jgi:hypothetical protein
MKKSWKPKKVSTRIRIYNMLGLLNHLYSKNLKMGIKDTFRIITAEIKSMKYTRHA